MATQNTLKRRISNRHAMDERELAFVRIYVAFGERGAPEAYRRAYLAFDEESEQWYPRLNNGEANLEKPPVGNQTAYRKAQALLELQHVQAYIEELKNSSGDLARQVLSDAVLFTDTKTALNAAERVLDDEDKLGFRDAVEQWAEIMCAIGAEVVLNDTGESVPMRALFPRYAEATPPSDVIQKTIESLNDYRDSLAAREAAAKQG